MTVYGIIQSVWLAKLARIAVTLSAVLVVPMATVIANVSASEARHPEAACAAQARLRVSRFVPRLVAKLTCGHRAREPSQSAESLLSPWNKNIRTLTGDLRKEQSNERTENDN